MAESTTQVLLFKTWYFGLTGWSRFQTDQSTMQNCHLIQNDTKFQWSVFIFWNRGFHAFVLTKFPLSLFNSLSCPYLTTTISISNDSLNLQQFPPFQRFTIIIPVFHGESFGVFNLSLFLHKIFFKLGPI